jgi:hypothetical protein
MIGSGKIAGYREGRFDSFVAMEFRTVVEGNGEELAFVLLDRLDARDGNFCGGSGIDLFDDHEAGFPFYQGHNTMMAVLADHGIALPVAYSVA